MLSFLLSVSLSVSQFIPLFMFFCITYIHLGAVRLWQTFFPALAAFLVSMLVSRKCLAVQPCAVKSLLVLSKYVDLREEVPSKLPVWCWCCCRLVVLTQSCLQTVCHSQNYHWSLPIEHPHTFCPLPLHMHNICITCCTCFKKP